MKRLLILCALALATASCSKRDDSITPYTDGSTSSATHCYRCTIMHDAYPCTVISILDTCDMTEAQIRAYEASSSWHNDSVTHTVTCQ